MAFEYVYAQSFAGFGISLVVLNALVKQNLGDYLY